MLDIGPCYAGHLFFLQFAKGLLEELGDQSKLGQRGELWTIAQFVTLALVVVPPFHSTVWLQQPQPAAIMP